MKRRKACRLHRALVAPSCFLAAAVGTLQHPLIRLQLLSHRLPWVTKEVPATASLVPASGLIGGD